MIDIFGEGSYLVNVTELFAGSLAEFVVYFSHFFAFAAIVLLSRRYGKRRWELAAAFLLPVLQLAWVWSSSIRSEFFLSFCLAALLSAQIYILDLMPYKALDYSFLFSVLLFPIRLFNNTSSVMGVRLHSVHGFSGPGHLSPASQRHLGIYGFCWDICRCFSLFVIFRQKKSWLSAKKVQSFRGKISAN